VLIAISHFLTSRTIPGRHIYALGGNAKAAKLSGINYRAGHVLDLCEYGRDRGACRNGVRRPPQRRDAKAGQNFELDAIAACYVGGASANGGIGTVIGAIIGGLFMGVLNNGMSIKGIGIDWQQAIKGFVLLAAVAFDLYSKAKSK
jgi:putative multiple sugar transport system permease protein